MSDLNKLKEELEEWQVFYEHPADEKNHAFFTTLISAVDQLEAAQQRIAELEDKEFRSSEIKKIMRERFEAAEAEIARRDAASGELVADMWIFRNSDGTWKECGTGYHRGRAVYFKPHVTAAQPSALPPEIVRNMDGFGVYQGRLIGGGAIGWYNQAIADAKALGCKAIKLPKIKHPAQFDYADDVIATLKAQGLSVEGDDDE